MAIHLISMTSELYPLNYSSLFYTTVADIKKLENTPQFVMCTTESILVTKTHLWDICISFQPTDSSKHEPSDSNHILKLTFLTKDPKHNQELAKSIISFSPPEPSKNSPNDMDDIKLSELNTYIKQKRNQQRAPNSEDDKYHELGQYILK